MIVIVVGMHRSGTSALAGLLHHNGIVMGESKNFRPRPKNNQNAKGFYENFHFRQINDNILQQNGYIVKSYNIHIPIIKENEQEIWNQEAYNLIKEYLGKYDLWGWKDPRNCLTLNFWLNIIEEIGEPYHVLISHRNLNSIAKSMKARGNGGSLENLETLSEIYYDRVNSIVGDKCSTIINFDQLYKNPKNALSKCPDFIKNKINDYSFLDEDLVHHQ